MGKGSPPAAPDPVKTAQAQTQSNKETATANAALNRVDQYTPYGSSTYNIIGNNPDGTPQYRQDVNLSPEQQALYDKTTQGQSFLGDTALGMLGQIKNAYDQSIDTSSIGSMNGNDYSAEGRQAQDAAYAKNAQYLDPQFETGQKSLEQQLANQGIARGSEAYTNATGEFGRTKQKAYDDARSSAISQGNAQQNQLFNQDSQRLARLLSLRSQPLNEYSALMSGSQVTNPTFGNVPTANQANTDVGGIYNQGYQNQMAQYNAKNQGINNLMNLGGTLGSALIMSDRRLKRDIERVGETSGGISIYEFRYFWEGAETGRWRGVMSDEVRHIPGAVMVGPDGFDRVNYAVIP